MKKITVVCLSMLLICGNAFGQSGESQSGAAAALGAVTTGINVVVGGMLLAKCETDAMSCAMGAMSMTAAAQSLMNMMGSSETQGKFKSGSAEIPSFGGGMSTPDDALKNVNNGLKLAADKGFKVDPKTGELTMPDGKKYSASAFRNGGSMAAAGLIPADQADDMDKKLAKMQKDALRMVSMPVAGGGGGGAASAVSSYKYEDPYAKFRGFGQQPGAAKTEGLTRTLASGESIGSSTDNVFEMITRRYNTKKEEGIFVSP